MTTSADVREITAPPWMELGSDLGRKLVAAAIELFAAQGYFATRTRDITERAGVSPAALYIPFDSKEDLLYVITRAAHIDIHDKLANAVADHDTPQSRVSALVAELVEWQAINSRLSFVTQSELRGLEPDHLHEIVEIRQQTEDLLRTELERGANDGDFRLRGTPTTASRVIFSMAIDVSRWYSPRAGDPHTLAATYAEMTLDMLIPARPDQPTAAQV